MIRAFKSTLEDMEEKRSIHSLRTAAAMAAERRQRSTAGGSGGGTAAGAEIGYIDEDGGGLATSYNGLGLGGGGGGKSGRAATATNQYLKVEGQTYRVQRVVQQPSDAASSLPVPKQDRIRRCSDAQTQSNESSFEALTSRPLVSHRHLLTTASSALSAAPAPATTMTNNCDAAVDPLPPPSQPPRVQVGPVGHVLPHPHPQSQAIPHSVSSSRNPSPVPPPYPPQPTAFVSVPAPPSPVATVLQAAYGYDPSYCQYLGQAADGYQYELVRRPSLGNPLTATAAASELTVPSSDHVLRRPSTGSPYPPPPHSPHYGGGLLAASSLHGSFDSCAAEAGTRPVPSPSAVAAAAAAVGQPLLVPSSHSPSYHLHSSQHFLYHAQPAPPTAAQPVLFTQQPPFQPASYQMYRHHSVSSSGGAPPAAAAAAAAASSSAPGYHPHQPLAHPGVTPHPPPAVGHMQSAFRMVGDHVEATAASSELSMPKMIHETSI